MSINSKVSIDEKYEKIMLTEDKYKVLIGFLNQLVDNYSKLEEQFKDYIFKGTWTEYKDVSLCNINVITSVDNEGDKIIHINVTINVDYDELGKRYDFMVDTSDSDDDFLHGLYVNVYNCDYDYDEVPTVYYDDDHREQLLGLYFLANFTSTSTYNDGDYLADRVALNINNWSEDQEPQDWDIVYTVKALYGDYYDNRGEFSFTKDEILTWKAEREVHYLKSILDKHNITY